MASWINDIVSALTNLGGAAHYQQLYAEIKRIRNGAMPSAWKKIVQRAIQDHAIESSGFKSRKLFYSVEGKGSGVWGLVTAVDQMQAEVQVRSAILRTNKLGYAGVVGPNQAWSRDELILALDLYLKHRSALPSKESSEVGQLSEFLNKLATVLGSGGTGTFRNRNVVYMKLMNYRRFDPIYTQDGKFGLVRGSKEEESVWNEFVDDRDRLQGVATAIRRAIEESRVDELIGEDELGIIEAEEGRVLTRLHRVRERKRALVENFKKVALKTYGHLACAACGFDFVAKYGEAGRGIIEVHHTKPIHTLVPGEKTKFEDLVLLCANCHRLVHSSRRWLTVEQVKRAVLEEQDRGAVPQVKATNVQ